MWKKFGLIGFAAIAFAFTAAPRATAGTDMVIDNSNNAPPPTYNYAPPPPPPPVVYYAPPPVPVVVAPTVAYYSRSVRVVGYHRPYGRHVYCPPRHWR